jgi:outer membrane protein assembly factor BamB
MILVKLTGRQILLAVYVVLACNLSGVSLQGQEVSPAEPIGVISAADQAAQEQVEQLVNSGQLDEAIAQLERLAEQRHILVPAGPVQMAGTQRVQVYHPLSVWCHRQRVRILARSLELRQSYEQRWNALAAAAYKSLQLSKDPKQGRQVAARFGATQSGPGIYRLLVDIHLEREHSLAASQLLDLGFPSTSRLNLSDLQSSAPKIDLPWYRVWHAVQHDESASSIVLARWQSVASSNQAEMETVLSRQLHAAGIAPQWSDLLLISDWAQMLTERLPDGELKQRLSNTLSDVLSWQRQSNLTESQFFHLDQKPKWQSELSMIENSADTTPASRPRVGETKYLLPYHPVIYKEQAFVHKLTNLRAFRCDDGQNWPSPRPDHALHRSDAGMSEYWPEGYPFQGFPRGQLTIEDNYLYARMGSPVTAWVQRPRNTDDSSLSYLVGLDLDKQGKMLPGFPLRLAPPLFESAELEGCPVVFEQMLITSVAQRDQTGVRRRLAAFDRFSGRNLWISEVLGSGVVAGSEQANLISNAQPVISGGLIYFCTDLGTVACVEPFEGQVQWMVSYRRVAGAATQPYRPQRFRYRDETSCLVNQGLVYCLPQDCAELMALDTSTGDLVWATNETDVQDAIQIVGTFGQCLLVNGDRLIWLDRRLGQVLSQFPALTTTGTLNALPQPRGLGSAALVGDRVYWPTSGKILVFSAEIPQASGSRTLASATHQILHRYPMPQLIADGCNLVADGKWLLMATPKQLLGFASE